jgi:hypothetical protein
VSKRPSYHSPLIALAASFLVVLGGCTSQEEQQEADWEGVQAALFFNDTATTEIYTTGNVRVLEGLAARSSS